MKFYFVKFTHAETNKDFYKFGITSKIDVLERFNTNYDERYGDFYIKVLYSAYGSDEQVRKVESTFLKAFPKNFILETYLEKPYGFYNGLSGVTETVVLTRPDVDRIMNILQNIKGEKNRLID